MCDGCGRGLASVNVDGKNWSELYHQIFSSSVIVVV